MFDKEIYEPALHEYQLALTAYVEDGFPYPRHFENRTELITHSRRFVARLFGLHALRSGKTLWVEKTPSNIIAMDLLWDLFPEATIVHIKRDPRGVLHSLAEQSWGPRQLDRTVDFLASIYWRWMMLKPKLDLQHRRYIEIKLEDLATRPGEVMEQVASVIGITPDFKPHHMAPELVDRWKTEMAPDAKKLCERRLGHYFPLMGYDI